MDRDIQCQRLPLPNPDLPDYFDISYKTLVKQGVAKGMTIDECQLYFCNTWDINDNKWTPISIESEECKALCEPDLFKGYLSIPEFIKNNDQVTFLKESGLNEICFGGKELSQVSGDCRGITSLPKPPPGVSAMDTATCNKSFENCDLFNCPVGSGGFKNLCNKRDLRPVESDSIQRVSCNTDKSCSCQPNTCYQSGLCLSQNDNAVVQFGLAKGIPEWQCPYYFVDFMIELKKNGLKN